MKATSFHHSFKLRATVLGESFSWRPEEQKQARRDKPRHCGDGERIPGKIKFSDLVDPAVGAGRWFVLMFVDVDVEFFAVALIFPVRNFIAEAK